MKTVRTLGYYARIHKVMAQSALLIAFGQVMTSLYTYSRPNKVHDYTFLALVSSTSELLLESKKKERKKEKKKQQQQPIPISVWSCTAAGQRLLNENACID